MVHIEDLPVELLHHIVSFVDDLDDLRDACLVSHKFLKLAQPVLFREFEDDNLSRNLDKIINFARSLYSNPELGNHVRGFSLLCTLQGMSDLSADDVKLFKRGIQDLHWRKNVERIWISAMEKTDPSIFTALVLNKTPNLRLLYLPGGQIMTRPFDEFFDRNPNFLSGLEQFHTHCETWEDFAGYNIDAYEHFLTRPNLCTASFENGDLRDTLFPSTWTTGVMKMRRLAFYRCWIDAGAFPKLMRACKNLKSFTYTNHCVNPNDRRVPFQAGFVEVDAAQAQEAALAHKNTLEYFHLVFGGGPWEPTNIKDLLASKVKVGSFSDFSVLRILYISHTVLPAHPRFPASLEKLHVEDCKSSVKEMVQNIATDCKNGLYPNLTEFKIMAIDVIDAIQPPGQKIPPWEDKEQCFVGLRKLFDGTSVNFSIEPYKVPDMMEYDEYNGAHLDWDEEDFDEYPMGAGLSGMDYMPQAMFDFLMHGDMVDPRGPFTADSDDD